VFTGRSRKGVVRRNRVQGGVFGISSFGYDGEPVVLPGTCSADPSRWCNPTEHPVCFIPGVDEKPLGACTGGELVDFFTGGIGNVLSGNQVSGSEICLSSYIAPSNRIEFNEASGCIVGVGLAALFLESGTVVGNRVKNNEIGLRIEAAESAGATVAFNDFTENGTAVEALQCDDEGCALPYTLPTDLAYNHWGLSCEEGGTPALPEELLPYVNVAPAYGKPVAQKYERAGDGDGLSAALCD